MLYADVRNAIGATEADTVILNAHFGMPDPTMPQSAARTVDVAKAIYWNCVATKVKTTLPSDLVRDRPASPESFPRTRRASAR